VINYPICYGTDNQYYLTHLADRTNNRNGSLFIDCNNSGDFSDDNTIIYGHHMSSGKMFARLVRYADQSYYQAHPVMYLTVGETRYRLELFAGYTTTADSDAYSLNFGSEEEKDLWLQEVSARSDFIPNQLTLCSEDRIVTLSTCAYSFPNARYVVHGKLTEL
jgi:sortase B